MHFYQPSSMTVLSLPFPSPTQANALNAAQDKEKAELPDGHEVVGRSAEEHNVRAP